MSGRGATDASESTSYGESVREIRAIEVGIAAAHVLRRLSESLPLRLDCCGPCEARGEAVCAALDAALARGTPHPPTPLALATAAICDELRRASR